METLNRLPWAAQSAVFQRLAEISDLSSLTREEREYYDSAIRIYRDNIYTLEGERQKGRAEGRAEGRADVARQLKAMGMALSDISKATGLQEADIEQL